MKKTETKSKAAHYLKIVEWSDEDQCFIGRCPGLFAGGIHGKDETKVYHEVCEAAEEWIANLEGDRKPLPTPTAGRTYSGKFVVRVPPELHEMAALKALVRRESLNQFVTRTLAEAP